MVIQANRKDDSVELSFVSNDKTEKVQLSFDESKELLGKLWAAIMGWKEDYNSLTKGSTIYYVYRDEGEIEEGKVFNVERADDQSGRILSVSIDFKDDFDEFDGSALGDCLFISKEVAQASMLGKPVLD